MSKERDPLIDNKAVRVYRDMARWNTNWIQRKEIAATVDENSQKEMGLWESVVYNHMLTGKFKGNVKALLSEFERLRMNGNGGR